MTTQSSEHYQFYRRLIRIYSGLALCVIAVLGFLHYLYFDLKVGGVYWFNLDKERNVPTWFSGILLVGLGMTAIVAYYWETVQNLAAEKYFRFPVLWILFACVAFAMSLDEMTILHENLFWREVRQTTTQLDESWRYLTQWQVLFAPAIFLIIGYMIVFFINRFRTSSSAMFFSILGIASWITALFLESVRQSMIEMGRTAYQFAMIFEELMEMTGTLCLVVAILVYVIDIAFDFTQERRDKLSVGSRLFSKKAGIAICSLVVVFFVAGGTAYIFAQELAEKRAPLPRLIRKVLGSNNEQPSLNSNVTERSIWFDDLNRKNPITPSDQNLLVAELAKVLLGEELSEKVENDYFSKYDDPRIVLVSLSDGASPARVMLGDGTNLDEAIEKVISQAKSVVNLTPKARWLKVDVVKGSRELLKYVVGEPLPFDHSIKGVSFGRELGIALLPEELLANRLVSRRIGIRRNRTNRYLRRERPFIRSHPSLRKVDTIAIDSFETDAYFSDNSGVIPLFRGHRLFENLSLELLLESARQGGDYLVRATRSDGRFVYSYRANKDEESEKYNILRHAGTAYSLLELYQITGEKKLLDSAKLSLDYLLGYITQCETKNAKSYSCIEERRKVKLGGNALAIIALAKYSEVTKDRQYVGQMQSMANWIKETQLENGEFGTHVLYHDTGSIDDFKSEYYPGEALLALIRLHKIDQSDSWLDIAEKGAQFLINERDAGKSDDELSHDHWLLYALNELYRLRPNRLYLAHSRRITHAIVNAQNIQPQELDWLGSFYRPPRSTPTATRVEGLCAAYQMMRDVGDEKELTKILEAIKRGIRFQLQTQFRPESAMYLKNPPRSLGGFRRSLTSYEVRIDYVQHNISALLGLYQIAQAAKINLSN